MPLKLIHRINFTAYTIKEQLLKGNSKYLIKIEHKTSTILFVVPNVFGLLLFTSTKLNDLNGSHCFSILFNDTIMSTY